VVCECGTIPVSFQTKDNICLLPHFSADVTVPTLSSTIAQPTLYIFRTRSIFFFKNKFNFVDFAFWNPFTQRSYKYRLCTLKVPWLWEKFLTVTEWTRPLLWSGGQSSWLQMQKSAFDSRLCQFFWQVVGLERGPLSLVNTIEELLERKSSGCGL
jgi:hypothetical protein